MVFVLGVMGENLKNKDRFVKIRVSNQAILYSVIRKNQT